MTYEISLVMGEGLEPGDHVVKELAEVIHGPFTSEHLVVELLHFSVDVVHDVASFSKKRRI